jgi:hypothetical protein
MRLSVFFVFAVLAMLASIVLATENNSQLSKTYLWFLTISFLCFIIFQIIAKRQARRGTGNSYNRKGNNNGNNYGNTNPNNRRRNNNRRVLGGNINNVRSIFEGRPSILGSMSPFGDLLGQFAGWRDNGVLRWGIGDNFMGGAAGGRQNRNNRGNRNNRNNRYN